MNLKIDSLSDLTPNYREICKKAAEDNSVFLTFKSNPAYNAILEHVSFEQGLLYINEINNKKEKFEDKIGYFKLNDSIGTPKKNKFEEPFGEISPTTIRYIKVLCDIFELFGSLKSKSIIEIGAGYGGQCKILFDAFELSKYFIIDLTEANLLISKFLDSSRVQKYKCISADNSEDIINSSKDKDFDLLISNYAFSECSRKMQDLYIDNIISRAKNGYMICNFISNQLGIDSYKKDELIKRLESVGKKVKELDEKPLTFNGNRLLIW